MKRILTALLALGSILLAQCGEPAFAAADKPLVIVSGQTQRLPSTDTLQINASATGGASINIPHGTAPSSPVNGDCWTTTGGFYCQINGSTVGPFGTGSGSGSVTSVSGSGGATGLTLTGGPITASGTLTLGGTLAVANGGTGTASYTDGQLLIGNTTGNTLTPATITAGSNITVTNGHGSITIASTASGGLTANPQCWTAGGANPCLRYGSGVPTGTTDPIGSLYLRTDSAQLWQQVSPAAGYPAFVQDIAYTGNSGTLGAGPTSGNLLVAVCSGEFGDTLVAGSGYTLYSVISHGGTAPQSGIAYKTAGASESTTQTPCTGGRGGVLYEISGVSNFLSQLEANQDTNGTTTSSISYTTTHSNDLALGFAGNSAGSGNSAAVTISGLSSGATSAGTGSTVFAGAGAVQAYVSNSSAISVTGTNTGGSFYVNTRVLVFSPLGGVYQQVNAFAGCYVYLSTPLAITPANSPIDINYDTELYNTSSCHSTVTNKNRITPPSWANYVSLVGKWARSVDTLTYNIMYIKEYDSGNTLQRTFRFDAETGNSSGSTGTNYSGVVPPIPYVAGHYFIMQIQSGAASGNANAGVDGTTFSAQFY